MIKFLKEESALTIIEVLVAIILTAIVMLHGTLFFMTSWRLSAESKDYSMILDDVIANLERCVARATNSVSNADYVVRTGQRTLRNGKYSVRYTITKQLMDYHQFYYVTSSARWRYDNAANDDSDNVINIKTAYYFRRDANTPTNEWLEI